MRRPSSLFVMALTGAACAVAAACSKTPEPAGAAATAPAESPAAETPPPPVQAQAGSEAATELARTYATVRLTADLSQLSDNERRMIAVLIRAGQVMDDLFWQNAYGDKQSLLAGIQDSNLRKVVEINYGPWDRIAEDRPLLPNVGAKPPGANFYPADMTKAEFEAADLPDKKGLYSIVRRGPDGKLRTIPYREAFRAELEKASGLLHEAAKLADDAGLRKYLELRAQALVTDDYQPSDLAWLDMKSNRIDVVIGPIENYEDALFGYRAAFEAYVLIKDLVWSKKLARFARLLPGLQRGLPVPAAYKRERPGTDSDLNAYDVVFYAGHSNAGPKTIAINLPNDEKVQLAKGTRRLQLKNTMRAKFDNILMPIARTVVSPEQLGNVTFDAFFANVMFHEVAHGLGIKNTVRKRGTVREALKDHAGALEEAKADILGLYMVTRLFDQGEIREGALLDHYVTFLAGIVRSVRFGASAAHGKANMVEWNFIEKQGGFVHDETTGTYKVDLPKMRAAVEALAARILVLQGDGDYEGVERLYAEMGAVGPALQRDLDRLRSQSIPVDLLLEQGLAVLGLPE